MFRVTLLLAVALLAHGPSPSGASAYVVQPDGLGDFPTVQAAIDAAVDGDVIELADGTFRGNGNRDIDYGGKAITTRSQSGNAGACIPDCQGSGRIVRRGFVFHTGEGSGSVLQGITVHDGYCDEYCAGAGIRCTASSPRILDCVIEDCSSRSSGGGVWCDSGSVAQFESCTFTRNWTMYEGGGVGCHGCAPAFSECVFSDNISLWEGGGLACYYDADPTLTDCVFTGNRSDMGGGGGGGVYCYRSSPGLQDCSFIENTSEHSGGGVMFYSDCHPTLTGCLFVRNASADFGGAIYCVSSSLVLERCTLVGNAAPFMGGGMCLSESDATVRGCTLIGNSAVDASGIVCSGHLNLGWTIVAFGVWGPGVLCEGTGTALLSCCDLYGNQGGDWVGAIGDQFGDHNNISADPLFCDLENDDFTLHADSPCAPESNPNCSPFGAWPVGCADTPVEETTWGAIKAMFRR